jgi:glycosyltransferase involved in cell wall biosynthesis
MRLSIIIPAYKVEKHIEKCIRSLENQDIPLTDYEIIVTNDGSPDYSAAIVAGLQKVYPNIQLINQENQGVSMARNHAIDQARGNYIMPIDPDDYVLPNTFKRVLEIAEQRQLDVLYLGFEIFDADENPIWHTDYSQQQDKIYNGVQGYYAARGNEVRDPNRSWGILYRREMIEQYQLRYPKDVPFLEDGQFLVKVFSVAQKVGFDNEKFHQRTTSKGSATVTGVYHTQKAIDGFLKAAVGLRSFSKKYAFTDEQKGLINHGLVNYVLLSLLSQFSISKMSGLMKTVAKIKELGFIKFDTDGVVEPYLTYACRFNISPYYFLFCYGAELTKKKIFS